jgi:Ran GTPase-activating protein (RanGAP) involved in mRNA processing and transport
MSSTIKEMVFCDNQLSVEGVRSMVPFLQNANNLTKLNLSDSNIQSEGFNLLFRELRDSPMKELSCNNNGIESIEIDSDHIPRNLKSLALEGNRINAEGCRGLAKLLQGGNSTLIHFWLDKNKIDDEGVAILVDALQNNTSLKYLILSGNDISIEGKILLLKLVNDISSIKATLETNHTLTHLRIGVDDEFQQHINYAVGFKCNRRKVMQTQLHNMRRAMLCRLQGIEISDAALYSEFDPLCLPEVLALVGQTHGLAELYMALKSSIATLFSTVNRIKCLEQEMAYHQARAANIQAEIAAIKRGGCVLYDSCNKRRRI